jgi:hypothetical protein
LEQRLALAVLFVDHDATGLNTGTSWPDAYNDLQSALATAQSGDEIWIAEGAYFPSSGTDRTATFRMVDGVNLYGGFAGDETAADQADPIGRTTLLNGNIGSRSSTEDNSLHVVTIDPGVHTQWDGISVFGGQASGIGADQQRGGGLLNAGSLVLNRSRFWSNQAQQKGGAIYNSGEIVITRGDLVGNMADTSQGEGGAIYNAGRLTIADSTLQSNGASRGGGILHDGDDLSIRNSSLIANYAAQGGGVYQRSGAVAFSHNTLAYNYAYGMASGGGIFATTHEVHLTHTLVAGNTQYSYTTPVQIEPFPDDVSGPFSPTSSFNLVGVGDGSTGLDNGANGNKVGSHSQPIDARLSSSGLWPVVSLTPLLDSPALDAGDPSFDPKALTPPLTEDQGGQVRVFDGDGDGSARIDIGSVETHSLRLEVSITNDEADGDYGPDDLSLREAILLANASGRPTTIDVPAGLYRLTHGEAGPCSPYGGDDHPGQLIVSGRPMTLIRGAGRAETIIDAGGRHRAFVLEGDVTLEDMAIQGGNTQRCGGYGAGIHRDEDYGPMTLRRIELRHNIARGHGGGLFADEDNVIHIIDSDIWGNRAEEFSDYDVGQGGGIFVRGSAVNLVGTRVRDNVADADGGGIALESGTSSLVRSIVEGNRSNGNGGGFFMQWSTLDVAQSDFQGNVADLHGGGIFNVSGDVEITNSELANNHADEDGGALYNVAGQVTVTDTQFVDNGSSDNGGAIRSLEGTLILNRAVVRGNSTDDTGGGLYATDAAVTVDNSQFLENTTDDRDGGGIAVVRGTLTLRNSSIRQNRAGREMDVDGRGGGLWAQEPTAIQLIDSDVSQNWAAFNGGGIYVETTGQLTIQRSRVADNVSRHAGGGLYTAANAAIESSTIEGNRAQDGGGHYAYGGLFLLNIRNSTYSRNEASIEGGGLFLAGAPAEIVQSTISGNQAGDEGGGLFLDEVPASGPGVSLRHSTITDNVAPLAGGLRQYRSSAVLSNSILAANRATLDLWRETSDLINPLSPDSEYSLIGIANAELVGGGTAIQFGTVEEPLDPHLGPLEYNGGPTRTHVPLPNSPVIEAGDPAFDPASFTPPLATDQRGFNRVIDGDLNGAPRIDIGSVEFSPTVLFADLTADGRVDLFDLMALQSHFGEANATYAHGDLNADSRIDSADASILLTHFGRTLPPIAAPQAAPQAAMAAQSPSATRQARLRASIRRDLAPSAVDQVLTTAPATPPAATRLRAARSLAAASHSPLEPRPI